MSEILRKLGHWFFCKIDEPIISPSKAVGLDDWSCMHCGKVHGTIEQKRDDYYKWLAELNAIQGRAND